VRREEGDTVERGVTKFLGCTILKGLSAGSYLKKTFILGGGAFERQGEPNVAKGEQRTSW